MQAYRKWILSLGIAAVTPGIALAGPFSFFKSGSDAQESPITSNQEMAEAVAQQLRKAKFSGFDIEIEVKSGVCRLGGKVTSESDRKLADSLARKVKGVRVIDNKLEVVDRETVRKQIQTAQAAPTPTAAPVQARTAAPARTAAAPQASAPVFAEAPFQSTAVERSKAPTLPTQTVAAPVSAPSVIQQAAAASSSGAQQPVEQVGFFGRGKQQQATSRGPSDQDIANQVALAVSRSGLRGHDISLTVRNGVATMSGQASSAQDVAALTQIVSQVSGVKQVDNQLAAPGQTRPAPPATGNQAVAQQIANALAANRLSGLDIEVRYNNGTAVLSGLVPHPVPAQIAEQVAYSVQGVERVENRLQVSGPPPGMQQGPQGGPPIQQVGYQQQGHPMQGRPMPPGGIQQTAYQQGPPMMAPQMAHGGRGASQMAYDMPNLPEHAWPSYASYPNYAAVSYPTEYSASAWPYIGPFYPYPQVPLGWRQVQLEWDDGNWNLNFRPRTERWYWWADPKNW
jgi:osmotically-inducible protein OsmY